MPPAEASIGVAPDVPAEEPHWNGCIAQFASSGRGRRARRLFRRHGRPQIIRSDNGREFVAASLLDFLAAHKVRPVFIEKGHPPQNAFVERFDGTMRDEKLNGEEFKSALEARVVLHAWIKEYNQLRPHRGLGMKTPQQFADEWKKGSA